MDWIVSPPISCVEALAPNVIVFGAGIFKEIRLDEVRRVGPNPIGLVSF